MSQTSKREQRLVPSITLITELSLHLLPLHVVAYRSTSACLPVFRSAAQEQQRLASCLQWQLSFCSDKCPLHHARLALAYCSTASQHGGGDDAHMRAGETQSDLQTRGFGAMPFDKPSRLVSPPYRGESFPFWEPRLHHFSRLP